VEGQTQVVAVGAYWPMVERLGEPARSAYERVFAAEPAATEAS
jgi:hypothetical protein